MSALHGNDIRTAANSSRILQSTGDGRFAKARLLCGFLRESRNGGHQSTPIVGVQRRVQGNAGVAECPNGVVGIGTVGDLSAAAGRHDAKDFLIPGDCSVAGAGVDVRLLAVLRGAGEQKTKITIDHFTGKAAFG